MENTPRPQGGQIPEGGHFGGGPVSKPEDGYSPPREVPIEKPVPGVIDPVAPMHKPSWETGSERGR